MLDSARTRVRRGARVPKQDRSRTSLRRLLDAAEPMLERGGYRKFTLQALSRKARVSIGSIYHRFDGKQALLRELQVRFLERVENEHANVINQLRREGLPLRELVPAAIKDYGEHLRRIAGLLRVFMEVAATDPVLAANGKMYADQAMRDFELLLLGRLAEIRHPEPEYAVATSYLVMYSVFARKLGFGHVPEPLDDAGWDKLIAGISQMILSFLIYDSTQQSQRR